MYIIECVSKMGKTRWVRNKPRGTEKLLFSEQRDDALEFSELSTAQLYRDDALEFNRDCFILGV